MLFKDLVPSLSLLEYHISITFILYSPPLSHCEEGVYCTVLLGMLLFTTWIIALVLCTVNFIYSIKFHIVPSLNDISLLHLGSLCLTLYLASFFPFSTHCQTSCTWNIESITHSINGVILAITDISCVTIEWGILIK